MSIALLIDFGSTYTKVAAVDVEQERFVGRAQAPSTVETDVTQGLASAIALLKEKTGLRDDQVTLKLACSSAAGGLRMVAVGLIGRLTAEAANRAALGAGAKVVGVFERTLSSRTARELEEMNPDVILLAGGVNDGNHEVIRINARRIAESGTCAPVVVAGNEEATAEVLAIFERAGQPSYGCENVMPSLSVLNVEPAREVIQEVFIRHIVRAKGLERAIDYVGGIVMPTPMAVLKMTELLASGTDGEDGLGDTAVVDIGGATTDIHTACWGESLDGDVPMIGLQEPFAKRTVAGDLGLRVSALSLVEAARRNHLPEELVNPLQTNEAWLRAEYLAEHPSTLPNSINERDMEAVMASAAASMAMERHAGILVSDGRTSATVQQGKDLTRVQALIGTGGVFAFGAGREAPLAACLFERMNPFSLRPRDPALFVDTDYVLYAGGLLATEYPAKALRLVKGSLSQAPVKIGAADYGNRMVRPRTTPRIAP